jgi:hypothetical protein
MQWHNGALLQAALAAGPGSAQQVHLFGLLSSLLKFAKQLPPEKVGRLTDAVLAAALAAASILQAAGFKQQTQQQQQQENFSQSGAAAAANLGEHMSDPAYESKPQALSARSSAPAGAQADNTGETASTEAADKQTPAQHSARDLLPWLVLFGRCCSIWAEQLQQGAVGQHRNGPISAYMYYMPYSTILDVFTQRVRPMTDVLSPAAVLAEATAVNPSSGGGYTTSGGGYTTSGVGYTTVPVGCLEACRGWLTAPSISAQLAADVYDVKQLSAKLDAALQAACAVQLPHAVRPAGVQQPEAAATGGSQQLKAAAEAAAEAPAEAAAGAAAEAAGEAAAEVAGEAAAEEGAQQPQAAALAGTCVPAEDLAQLVQQLRAVGQALSTLATSSACNNPSCSNISGPSEAGLVKGSSSTCGGCRTARYCCRACQTQHW